MKVYVIIGKDYGEGPGIEQVFSDLELACNYIIRSYFNINSFYSNMSYDEKLVEAKKHIHECVVEQNSGVSKLGLAMSADEPPRPV